MLKKWQISIFIKLLPLWVKTMTMRNIPLFAAGALLVAWLWGGSAWYERQYCGSRASVAAVKQPLMYIEDELNEIASAPAPEFRFNETQPVLATATVIAFQRLADYLGQHPDRRLIVTGHSHAVEENEATGMKRAEAIAQLLVQLGAPAASITSLAGKNEKLAFDNGVSWLGISLGFDLNDRSHPDFMPLNLYFKTGKYRVVSNRALEEYAGQLRDFLQQHPELVIQISGYMDKKETATSASLALKRARGLRDYLVKAGISSRHLLVKEATKEVVSNQVTAKNQRAEIRITRA